MQPTRPKLPREAIELYNLFIHNEISRRDFMDGVQPFCPPFLRGFRRCDALIASVQGRSMKQPNIEASTAGLCSRRAARPTAPAAAGGARTRAVAAAAS
jgi:hypothetical protein